MLDVLVDTDVLIDYTKGFSDELSRLFEMQNHGRARLWVSPVILAEFTNDQKLANVEKMTQMRDFLENFEAVKEDKDIGLRAGELMRSEQLDYLGDAMVAAVCLEKKKQLLTRNKKHFVKVKGLEYLTSL
jgi:predicted nucleic acid-binding protein